MKKNRLLKIGWLCALPFLFSSLSFAQYVAPSNQITDGGTDYISNISFNSISNASTISYSGAAAYWGDYTGLSTTVNPSTTYSLSVSVHWSEYPGDKLYVYVFFDWNHDYDFVDANEYYIVANGLSSTGSGGHIYNLTAQNITIPSDASLSNIRMRVRMIVQASDPGIVSMKNFTGGFYGEIEDYTINIAAPTPAPTVTGISPTSGPTTGGTSVVITGTNLTGATAVNFGGTAGSITANTATSITVTSPAKSAGTVDITVTTAGGTSTTSTSDQFTYAASGTFTQATSTDWATASNWIGGVPTSSTDVTIPSGKTVVISATTQASCNDLTVSGTLTIQSSASGTGSLIVSGTSTGSVTCQRYMTNGKWHLISPTASGQTVAAFLTANTNIPTSGSTRGMMDYSTLGNSWNSYYPTTSASGTMDAGKGYSSRIATTDGTISFTGTLTTGTKTVALTTTGQGWNCVGNPYTSAINMNTTADATNNFITVNSSNLDASYACVYVWDEDATYPGQSCYKVISNSGFSTTKTILAQNYVAPGQGFFVKAKTGASNVSFTSAMQSYQNSTNAPFKAPEAKTSWPGIVLKAASEDVSSSAIIAFNDNMTKGLDPTYDAGLLRGTNGLSLYTRLVEDNGVDFAIQCLPESYNNLVIPVGVDCKDGGELTFSAETVNLPVNCNVILEDKTTNTFTSLTAGTTYKTTVAAGATTVGRFYIHTGLNTTTGISGLTAEASNLKAYIANEVIVIEGEVSDQAIATLYNLQGLKVRVNPLQKGSLNSLPCSDLTKGIYLLTIQQNGETATRKLIKE